MKTKYFFAQVRSVDLENRTIDAVASTSDLDRDKDIILPSAFKESLPSFRANPVILACHQHRLSSGSSPVIGSAIPESVKITDTEVLFTMRFAETDLGEEYWQLYKDKHMRAFSIGFIAIEWKDEKDENLGYVRTYTKIELLEISAVPVPSNRRALARAKGYKGFFDDDDDESRSDFVKELHSDTKRQLDEFTLRIEDHLHQIKSLLSPDRDRLAEKLLDDSEPSDPAGDNKTEQVLEVINQIKNKL